MLIETRLARSNTGTRTKKAAIVDAGDPMGSHAYFDKAKEKGMMWR